MFLNIKNYNIIQINLLCLIKILFSYQFKTDSLIPFKLQKCLSLRLIPDYVCVVECGKIAWRNRKKSTRSIFVSNFLPDQLSLIDIIGKLCSILDLELTVSVVKLGFDIF